MKTKIVVIASALILLFSCGSSLEKANEEQGFNSNRELKDSAKNEIKLDTDTGRQFIRTANLRFEVKNAQQSGDFIEAAVARHGGFVLHTNLQTLVQDVTSTPISRDSTLERKTFKVVGEITFRVPNYRFDSALKEISTIIDFLDERNITAEDVRLDLLGYKLQQERYSKQGVRLENKINTKGKKLKESVLANEMLNAKEEQGDQSFVSNLRLIDQVNYSTVTLQHWIWVSESLKA
jgi:hypothetical protein